VRPSTRNFVLLFAKRPKKGTPMEQFLARDELSVDERAILDLYLTGVAHALTAVNAVHAANGKDPVYTKVTGHPSLEVHELEAIIADFLKQRPDMKRFALGLVAVSAVLQKHKPA